MTQRNRTVVSLPIFRIAAPHSTESIRHDLNSNVSKSIASERMAVSADTLDEHYDARSREEKRQARQNELTNL
ncbi:hypothetical protein C9J85_07515 [Haloferax sp. wsp5]|nr:hypothetical protein C9J85_07515 [Haloferax sp. wsp5]